MRHKFRSDEEPDAIRAAAMSRVLLTFPFAQTERSHEENQERAYIAASRRQDRSIEARIQSARMASEIHKGRTGKAFVITEEIVRNEEMYEEEETEFPRSIRLLNSQLETSNAEFNARVENWMSTKMFMTQYMETAKQDWENNHINRLFAESFPQANQQAQAISRNMSFSGGSGHCGSPSPRSPQLSQQPSPQSPVSSAFHSVPTMSPTPMTNNGSTPGTPVTAETMPFNQNQQSAFNNELPAEMQFMMDTNLPPTYEQNFYSQHTSNMGNTNENFFSADPIDISPNHHQDHATPLKFGEMNHPGELPTNDSWQPTIYEEPSWDSFIHDGEWTMDQDQ